ncbi:MAG: hypothetical protein AAB434_13230 [Planctomycetota bacterium]
MGSRLVTPIVVAALLGTAGGLQLLIDRAPERKEALAERPFQDLPPDAVLMDYVGSQFLGSFRSLVVSTLCQRADKLKEEEQFDELLATSSMICRLQPHLAEAWEFNAYNMAYNLSWQQEDRDMRWQWVQEGIRLYQEGLRRNPRSTLLHFKLGFVYWNRIPQEEYLVRRVPQAYDDKETFQLAEHWFEESRRISIEQAREAGRPIDYLFTNEGPIVDARYSFGVLRMIQAAKQARLGNAAEARRLLAEADAGCLAAAEKSFEVSTFAPDPPFWRNRAALYRDLARTRTILAPCLLDECKTWVEQVIAAPRSREARWPSEVLGCARRTALRWKELSTTPVQIFAMQIVLESLSEVFEAWDAGREEEALRLLEERAAFCDTFTSEEGGWTDFAASVRSLKQALAKTKAAAEAERAGDRAAAGIAREEAKRVYSLFIEGHLRLDVDLIRGR